MQDDYLVGIFTKLLDEPVVPDVLLSLHVTIPKERKKKEDLCYYLDKLGKPPEVVIEIVSNKVGKELDEKLISYAKIGKGNISQKVERIGSRSYKANRW